MRPLFFSIALMLTACCAADDVFGDAMVRHTLPHVF